MTHGCHFEPQFAAMTDPFSLRYEKYSLRQKEDLALLCFKYKQEAEKKSKGKHWDAKQKKYVSHNLSYKSRAVRKYYPSLKNADSNDPDMILLIVFYNCKSMHTIIAFSRIFSVFTIILLCTISYFSTLYYYSVVYYY